MCNAAPGTEGHSPATLGQRDREPPLTGCQRGLAEPGDLGALQLRA